MFRIICVAVLCILMQACTVKLKMEDYQFQDSHIKPFDVKGNLTITSSQQSSEEITVYSASGVSVVSDLKTLTDLMVRESTEQAKKRGSVKNSSENKSIELKIITIKSEPAFYHAKSKMLYQIKLGNGEVFTKSIEHASADPHQDITGCVASGVIALLQDEKVTSYLAQ